jgi:type IV secretory pathway VirB9-like protein
MTIRKTLALALISAAALFSQNTLAADPNGETVTIRNDGDNTYYEFRVNGKISEIKVVPKVGKPYYLVPTHEEDGDFIRKDNPEMRIPKWVIFRW